MHILENTSQQTFASLDEMLANITQGETIEAVCPGQIKINSKEDWYLVGVITFISALVITLYELKVDSNWGMGIAIGLTLLYFIGKFFVEYSGGRIDDAVVTTNENIWLVFGVKHLKEKTEETTFTYEKAYQLTSNEIQKKMSQRPYRMLRFKLPNNENIRFSRSGLKAQYETQVVPFRDASKLLYHK